MSKDVLDSCTYSTFSHISELLPGKCFLLTTAWANIEQVEKVKAWAECEDSDAIFQPQKVDLAKWMEKLCWYFTHITYACGIQINRLFTQLCVSEATFQEFLCINVVEQRRNKVQPEHDEGSRLHSGQVAKLCCAVQLKWPMTYHTRRYAKTDHLLHVQQYLLYGWLKWMRTFHVSTGLRVKRDESRDQSWVKQLLQLNVNI